MDSETAGRHGQGVVNKEDEVSMTRSPETENKDAGTIGLYPRPNPFGKAPEDEQFPIPIDPELPDVANAQ